MRSPPGDLGLAGRIVATVLIVVLVPFTIPGLVLKALWMTGRALLQSVPSGLRGIWAPPLPNRRSSPAVSGGSSLPLKPRERVVTFEPGQRLH